MERRSPTGIARERETRTDNAAPANLTAANPRIAESRGHGARQFSRWGPPNRAGARNPHQQRCAPPISPLRTAYRRSALNRGDMERASSPGGGLRPASRGSAKPAPMTVRRTDVSGAPPAQSGLRCSLRFAQRCRPEVGVPLPARRLCSIGIAPSARLRRAVPTGGRRSLAGASSCPWGYPPRCVARRLASRSEGERGRWPPFHTFPPKSRAANGVRCHCCCALGSTPPAQNRGDMERWPVLPVGASDRHRAGARNRADDGAPYRREWRIAPAQSGLRRSPRCAGRCRPEVGVPLPARHRA